MYHSCHAAAERTGSNLVTSCVQQAAGTALSCDGKLEPCTADTADTADTSDHDVGANVYLFVFCRRATREQRT